MRENPVCEGTIRRPSEPVARRNGERSSEKRRKRGGFSCPSPPSGGNWRQHAGGLVKRQKLQGQRAHKQPRGVSRRCAQLQADIIATVSASQSKGRAKKHKIWNERSMSHKNKYHVGITRALPGTPPRPIPHTFAARQTLLQTANRASTIDKNPAKNTALSPVQTQPGGQPDRTQRLTRAR